MSFQLFKYLPEPGPPSIVTGLTPEDFEALTRMLWFHRGVIWVVPRSLLLGSDGRAHHPHCLHDAATARHQGMGLLADICPRGLDQPLPLAELPGPGIIPGYFQRSRIYSTTLAMAALVSMQRSCSVVQGASSSSKSRRGYYRYLEHARIPTYVRRRRRSAG